MSAMTGQVFCIEHLYPARHVIGHGDQAPILADGAADAVAALDDAPLDALAQQVDLGQPAIAGKHVGIALVAGKHRRGVGQVAQPLDTDQFGHAGALDNLHAATGAFDHQAQVAAAAQRGLGTGTQQQAQG